MHILKKVKEPDEDPGRSYPLVSSVKMTAIIK
jgi:hypothetical protein